ncbi:interleukin-8-like [Rhinatrema bivittatum]|uniref:interleukin-8-like n=1 Tax=Rhinatrema bivittatum TaxID=194408 RepID=UPI001127A59B|nr:interleukin-8-like [Rhinatrema bivittatum]
MEIKNRMITAATIICLLSTAVTEAISLARMGTELRCHCVKMESRFILPKNLLNVQLIPSGPHCSNTEVIATLKSGLLVCLEPKAPWVKKIIKKILESSKPTPETRI